MTVVFSTAPLEQLAQKALGSELEVVEMPGGASLRRFFRVSSAGQRAVGMFFPDALTSEEASGSDSTATRWPFLEVRDLLAQRGVAVPKLLGEDCERGWILVEDLGDDTLAEVLTRHPERKTELYRRVVSELGRAHDVLRELPPSSVVARRSFDVELLHWEIDHFREWGLEGRGISLDASQRARFDRLAHAIAAKVRALPYGFAHRDFQSRNLMLAKGNEGERVVWVDFQDALRGPRVYDLVALLGDSYQTFDDVFVRERLADYAAVRELSSSLDTLFVEFDWVTVQRKLKDAGRFVFIQHKKGDASYLRFVEPTIALVRRSLARLQSDPDARELQALLDELGAKLG
jgi:N-acetylmuramate 1-kinase